MITAIADTHAVIWYIFSDSRLSEKAKSFLDKAANEGNQVGVYAITLVEMIYLVEKGRITSEAFSRTARALNEAANVLVEVPIDVHITRTMTGIDVKQIPEMPDRIIAATAEHLQVPLISRDSKIQLSNTLTIW